MSHLGYPHCFTIIFLVDHGTFCSVDQLIWLYVCAGIDAPILLHSPACSVLTLISHSLQSTYYEVHLIVLSDFLYCIVLSDFFLLILRISVLCIYLIVLFHMFCLVSFYSFILHFL